MLSESAFAVNASAFDGRALEELFAQLRPGRVPGSLGGAIVDATFAADEPALLPRLRQLGLPFAVEPQSVRFRHPSFLETKALASLPYAPTAPLSLPTDRAEVQRLVLGALRFQSRFEPTAYVVPALPFERPVGAEAESYRRIHETAAAFNGSEVGARRLIGVAPVGTQVLRSPYSLLGLLSQLRLDALYFQPLELDPKHDSVERLASYVTFIMCAAEYSLPVIAGRVGAFGLILLAFGVHTFDSGLLQREAFSLRGLQRPRARDGRGHAVGGRSRRVYLSQIFTSVNEEDARKILRHRSLRSRYICSQGKCRSDYQSQWRDSRAHFLHSRLREVNQIRALPTREMRLDAVSRMLLAAIEHADMTNRVLEASGLRPLNTDHLRRWMAVIERVSTRRGWRLAS